MSLSFLPVVKKKSLVTPAAGTEFKTLSCEKTKQKNVGFSAAQDRFPGAECFAAWRSKN
ncbi:unnamed protein product [Ectocarpus sp. CCAP 1310/34]|nr:unnamed protein product [Ectocarpus sp. CCAP 1310/34]